MVPRDKQKAALRRETSITPTNTDFSPTERAPPPSGNLFATQSFPHWLCLPHQGPLMSHSPSGQGPPLDQMLLWQTGRGHKGEVWAMGLLRFLPWGVVMQSAQKPLRTWTLQLCIRKPHCR